MASSEIFVHLDHLSWTTILSAFNSIIDHMEITEANITEFVC